MRQLTAAGTVILAQTYAPYGSVISSFGTGTSNYGFAGEWTDGTGLQHLRARYMDPGTGRFITRDTWAGDYNSPMSLNRWMYVQGNPVNYTDPSGKSPSDGDGYVPPNHRDLTSWLYREMYANANSAEARSIRETIDLSQKINDLSKGKGIGIWAGGIALSKLVWSIAATDWISLVKDGARWDFKDQIYDKMKKTIMLCHQVECEWFEYSVPGNIHYGYVGRASGFSSGILHGGASYAEITDPSHRELIKMYGRWFVNLHIDFSDCDINIPNIDIYANFDWWKTGFDDTTDFASVELGSQIFDISGYSPSMSTYQNMLWLFSPQLDHMPKPSEFYSNPDWPYPLRYFDGGG